MALTSSLNVCKTYMNNTKSKADSNNIYMGIAKVLLWVVFILFLMISIFTALFLWEELQRERLLRKYSLAAASTNIPDLPGVWDTTLILQSNETIACVMGSYGDVDELPALNKNQKVSLPKSELPSEDGSWYLLTFSERQVERVALHPIYVGDRVFAVEASCGDRASQLLITPRTVGTDQRKLTISFHSK